MIEIIMIILLNGGGEISGGGEDASICAAESRLPPNLCFNVDSSNCSRTISSQPLPPCQTKPTNIVEKK